MTHDHSMHHQDSPPQQSFWRSRAFLVFLGFAAIALVMSWEEHKAHILGALPFLFLLACPFMHVFMHGGHGHDDHRPPQGGPSDARNGGKS